MRWAEAAADALSLIVNHTSAGSLEERVNKGHSILGNAFLGMAALLGVLRMNCFSGSARPKSEQLAPSEFLSFAVADVMVQKPGDNRTRKF